MDKKRCPMLETNANGISDPNMTEYLTTMMKFECVEDECPYIEDCWKQDIVEEVMEDGKSSI